LTFSARVSLAQFLARLSLLTFKGLKMIDDYELITYIDDNGVALDDHGHEFRDENGQIVVIPLNERRYFKTIERV
jgi:hypothetical protein